MGKEENQIEKRPAVFFDRDGVLIVEKNFQKDPGGMEFNPGTVAALRKLDRQYRKVVISNQSGIARGYFTVADLQRFNRFLEDRLKKNGIEVDGWYFCPHGPHDNCRCRKPEPGMLQDAGNDLHIDLNKSWIVGDKSSDMLAGKAVGLKTILLRTGYAGREPAAAPVDPDYTVNDLDEAVDLINGGLR